MDVSFDSIPKKYIGFFLSLCYSEFVTFFFLRQIIFINSLKVFLLIFLLIIVTNCCLKGPISNDNVFSMNVCRGKEVGRKKKYSIKQHYEYHSHRAI